MVANILGCLSVFVLLLTLSSTVTLRSLRMKRDISPIITSTNANEMQSPSTVAEAKKQMPTTIETPVHTVNVTPKSNVSTVTEYRHTPDLNHTQQITSAGTENLTIHPPAEKEISLHTQLPTTNNGTGHIAQAGGSTPTFPATSEPGKVTEKHTTMDETSPDISTTTRKASTVPTHTHSCPSASSNENGLVGRCLIAIASMAALTTIFIISTICLATKLSAYRYRHKAHLLQETEMVCISALMNDTDHPVPKPRRHPKSNGALIPNAEDGDPDGDNLTLNSFLPDTEGPL